MEHLAHVRKEDPLDFRLKNLNRSDENELSAIQHIISEVRISSNYNERRRQVMTKQKNYVVKEAVF